MLTAQEIQELRVYTLLSTEGTCRSNRSSKRYSSCRSYKNTGEGVQCAQAHSLWQDVTCSHRSSSLESSYKSYRSTGRGVQCAWMSPLTVVRYKMDLFRDKSIWILLKMPSEEQKLYVCE